MSMHEKLVWGIADKTIRVDIDASNCPKAWELPLASHRMEPAGSSYHAHLTVKPVFDWMNPNAEKGIRIEEGPGAVSRRIFMERPVMSGVLEDRSGRYEGEFVVPGESSVPLAILVRAVLSFLCEDEGRLLLHASAVRRGERVWVFFGPSGSGKSTIAVDLRAGGQTVAVDRVVLAPCEDGEIQVYSTPFGDEESKFISAPFVGDAAGIILIEQAKHSELMPLSSDELVPLMLKETLAFSRDPDKLRRTMQAVGAVAESGIVHKLKFARNETFWELLDGAHEGQV
jgi:hypothetical protein